jgi:hypothetical protein
VAAASFVFLLFFSAQGLWLHAVSLQWAQFGPEVEVAFACWSKLSQQLRKVRQILFVCIKINDDKNLEVKHALATG